MKILNPRDANGPDGYPKYDPEHPYWIILKKVYERTKKDAERAKRFLKKLREDIND